MVKLLIYGYATRTPSSRKLEVRTYSDVAVRFLCADQHPDFRPIARFRRRHLEALAELFVQALRPVQGGRAGGAGVAGATKLRANASRHTAMSYERIVKAEAQLEAEIAAIRANARRLFGRRREPRRPRRRDERFGAARRGDELELGRREQRLARIREAKATLEAAAERERQRREQAEREQAGAPSR